MNKNRISYGQIDDLCRPLSETRVRLKRAPEYPKTRAIIQTLDGLHHQGMSENNVWSASTISLDHNRGKWDTTGENKHRT